MVEFFAALAIFLVSHSVPARPAMRSKCVALLGERPYLFVYSIVSLGLLAWLLSAASRAPYIALWEVSLAQYFAPIVLMVPAFFLFGGGAFCPNPLSVSFSRTRFDPARPGIVAITRHPLLWGFALWALAHMVPNGDLVSVMMFGGFGLFALLAMPLIDRRKRRALGPIWTELARQTSILPGAAWLSGRTVLRWRWHELLATLIATASLYAGLLWAHPYLFGPDPKIIFAAP
ncbi:NnrU family protein [Sphingopyxis fribergensis]